MNKLTLSLGLTLALAPVILFNCQTSQAKSSKHSTAYMVQLPVERSATKLIAMEGEFKPSKYTQILTEHSGKITHIFVEDGDYVEKGQPLLEFDSTIAALAVKAAEGEYQLAIRNIIELTRTTNENDPKYVMASHAVEETRKNLLSAQQDQNATTMYAPFAGKLGQIKFNSGNYANKGELVTELVASDTVELHFNAPSKVLEDFRQALNTIPDNLRVSIPGHDGRFVDGKLTYVDAKLSNQQDLLNAYAVFNNQNGEHLIGSTTAFYLNSPQAAPQLFVPATSLHTQEGASTLFVLDDQRIVRSKQVTLAKIKETYTGYVPIESGLEPDDFVLMTPEAPALEGQRIDPMVNLVNQLNEILNRQR
ncbi:efflux transporter periplasmic adaptor subunit [Vibrio coralliilyticus]|uniref:efflux RND transporter periplasmic adaptor subunit n=1 Tax=Vibrio coralliilyticus TaxID=190893 RepID=UPI000810858F|nr:efflux RND transporter periplasmic adaptor subunit [Vibrio coralliilyticus]ANW26587.1 efflux transporter periplasmic adaptor subunit [Vibrio coralliilyticus]